MSEKQKRLKIGITIGDINGIGPELIIKSFEDNRLFKLVTPVVFANPKIISFYKKALSIEKLNYVTVKDLDNLNNNGLNIMSAWNEEVTIEIGKPNKTSGEYALKSIKAAANALKDGKIDALVTCPINKKAVSENKNDFIGHTEYLQQEFGNHPSLMFMVSEKIKVGVVTNHLPVQKIADAINVETIQSKLRLMHASLKEDFGIEKPKIAVLGLNPHCGDAGLIGDEEEKIIIPAINQIKKENILAFGPYAADGFFGKGDHLKFDAILAMYHDQGLIPFKYIAGEKGVNFTAGLPIIRTSPDHGPAENIVAKNKADNTSFLNAIYMAIDIHSNRSEYFERKSNALKK